MRDLLSHSLFFEISALLVLAAGIGSVGHLLRQPLIVSFIAVGIIAGPSALDITQSSEKISALSELGIAVLLFLVGLKLDVKLSGRWARSLLAPVSDRLPLRQPSAFSSACCSASIL